MADLQIEEWSDFGSFSNDWGDYSDNDVQMLWQLLGTLEQSEILIEIPEWLAEKKAGYVEGATPTLFIGTIGKETEKAIRLDNSADARALMKPAHRLTQLEETLADNDEVDDRRDWLERRQRELERTLAKREDTVSLQEAWIPKSQIERAGRRID